MRAVSTVLHWPRYLLVMVAIVLAALLGLYLSGIYMSGGIGVSGDPGVSSAAPPDHAGGGDKGGEKGGDGGGDKGGDKGNKD